jgi:hypothetical protein
LEDGLYQILEEFSGSRSQTLWKSEKSESRRCRGFHKGLLTHFDGQKQPFRNRPGPVVPDLRSRTLDVVDACLARDLGQDDKRVHEDLQALLSVGLVENYGKLW